jgi:hypothetical protein
MRMLCIVLASLAAIGSAALPAAAQNSRNICLMGCLSQRNTCYSGCNAGGGTMLHVQACMVGCEQGQAACASRCR